MRRPDTQTDLHAPVASRARWVFLGFALLGGAMLILEHRAHLLGWLPWLILLLCPLMHFFMHRGHGHGGHGRRAPPANGAGEDK